MIIYKVLYIYWKKATENATNTFESKFRSKPDLI